MRSKCCSRILSNIISSRKRRRKPPRRASRKREGRMDKEQRKKLVEQYKDGYRVVAEALAGATDEELDARPAPNKWSAREIVHHLADSEMTAAVRLRLLVGTDNPQIYGYNQ